MIDFVDILVDGCTNYAARLDIHIDQASTSRSTPRTAIVEMAESAYGLGCCVAIKSTSRFDAVCGTFLILVFYHIIVMSLEAEQSAKKTTSSVEDTVIRKAPFGSRCVSSKFALAGELNIPRRYLKDENEVWNFNAWDHVPPPDDQGEVIAKALEKQRLNPVPMEEKPKYNDRPSRHWCVLFSVPTTLRDADTAVDRDNFYKMNNANFFKNRRWLNNEFPELIAGTKAGVSAAAHSHEATAPIS